MAAKFRFLQRKTIHFSGSWKQLFLGLQFEPLFSHVVKVDYSPRPTYERRSQAVSVRPVAKLPTPRIRLKYNGSNSSSVPLPHYSTLPGRPWCNRWHVSLLFKQAGFDRCKSKSSGMRTLVNIMRSWIRWEVELKSGHRIPEINLESASRKTWLLLFSI